MQRAEHKAERNIRRAERDMRRAERRGEIMSFVPMTHRPGPVIGTQDYLGQQNGYEMRDMQHQQPRPQQQGTYMSEGVSSRELGQAGSYRPRSEDVPPPAYEEVDKKQ